MKQPTALIILDGYGQSEAKEGNAVYLAKTPVIDSLFAKYPHTLMAASGLDVGLPAGQMGNSEVGHLNIGAGRIIYQDLTRITKSIEDGDFFENPVLVKAMDHAKQHGTKLHTWGLLSDGGVHSHIDHLKAVIRLAKQRGLDNIYVHAFMDGRDTPPQSGLGYVRELEAYMHEIGFGVIASVSGRYYAMDRDKRWERVEKAYDALVYGKGNIAKSATEVLERSYAEGVTDEFVVPTVIVKGAGCGCSCSCGGADQGKPIATVSENDSILFFNFRPDRARELTRAFLDKEFAGFERRYFPVHYAGMTTYDVTIEGIETAYAPKSIDNTLGEYVASLGKTQLRIAETEKYAHVTFFFNGGVEAPNPGEDRVLIDSPKVATYDLKPEMSAYELTDRLLSLIDEDKYDLIICNFANPDMVGHTGVLEAAVAAVEAVDHCLGRIIPKLEAIGAKFIITADHGNAEEMIAADGSPMTAHTSNRVPLLIGGVGAAELRDDSRLADLAPTLLQMMGLPVPKEMAGTSILK